jgi:integrase
VPVPHTNARRTKASPKYPGVYYWTAANGKRHYEIDLRSVSAGWETLGPVSLQDAVHLRGDRISRAKLKGEKLATGAGPTFAEVRREWEAARKLRERTTDSYDANLKLYAARFESKRIRSIDRAQLVLWIGQLRSVKTGERLADGTEALVVAAVSAVFEHAIDVGYVAKNPVKELRGHRPKQGQGRRRILSHDEEARLLAACGRRDWLRAMITVALYQALRLAEVAGLQREDIDLGLGKLRVHQQLGRGGKLVPTKSTTKRRRDPRDVHPIDLMPPAQKALRDVGTSLHGFVFLTRNGGPKSTRDISRAFSEAVEKAKLPVTEDGAVTFHALRHTGISRLANHPSIPLVYVRDFAGHASLQTTEGYVHKIASSTVTAAAAEAMGGMSPEPQAATGLRRVK